MKSFQGFPALCEALTYYLVFFINVAFRWPLKGGKSHQEQLRPGGLHFSPQGGDSRQPGCRVSGASLWPPAAAFTELLLLLLLFVQATCSCPSYTGALSVAQRTVLWSPSMMPAACYGRIWRLKVPTLCI